MDAFDYKDTPRARPPLDSLSLVFNILTVVCLLGTLCVGAVFFSIFINPNSSFNPIPPPTLPAVAGFPTVTPTPLLRLPPTWTPEPTKTPLPTNTPYPTSTPWPTFTPYGAATATQASTPGGYTFVVQQGSPASISSQPFKPNEGCNWMGVAGQVFDMRGAGVPSQMVYYGGTLAGAPIPDTPTITGLLLEYGRGYYEISLADHPVASKGTLWVQLRDQQGLAMSDKFYFDTFDSCDKNMIIINFSQVR